MRRLSLVLVSAVALLLAGTPSATSGRSTVSLAVSETNPPQLVVPGDRAEVRYVIDTANVLEPTGTVFVRRDGQSKFTALPLQLGSDISNGRHPALHLALPSRFLRGQRIFYYAQLQDPAGGAAITIPAKGARAPQTSWVMHRSTLVRLGNYRFGHPQAAEAVAARTTAKGVGWDLRAHLGPSTFLIGRDRSIWLEDAVDNRMLVWLRGRPNQPVRSLRLPTEGRHDIRFQDVAFGPKNTLYATRIQKGIPGFQLFRINASTGRVLWRSNSFSPASSAGLPDAGVSLRVGSDGALYAYVDAAEMKTPGTPSYGWMPLATSSGKPIPRAQQFDRIVWGHEPAPRGRQFIAEYYLPANWRGYSPHGEWRFGIVNRYGRLLRGWRITSKTPIDRLALAPQLLDGKVVADLAPVAGAGKLEHFFVRLDSNGLDAKASLPFQIWGNYLFTDVRVGPDGRIYALATSPKTGIVIHRYALGRS